MEPDGNRLKKDLLGREKLLYIKNNGGKFDAILLPVLTVPEIAGDY